MPDDSNRAYVAGLTMLARRELCEAQVRQRLNRRAYDEADIDAAVTRLRRERALDDRRTALACARTEVRLRHRGRARVLRQVEALGISRRIAREAVTEVFAELDEGKLLEQALDKRLRRGAITDAGSANRVRRYLLVQGFDPAEIASALRKRTKRITDDD
jgi:SOS response regulatory protein OraA/RecX